MAQSPSGSQVGDLGRLLRGVGLALIIYYVLGSTITLVPPAFLNPEWYLRVSATLTNSAFLPLIGSALIVVSSRFSDRNSTNALIGRIRRWAALATVGFILLVPLEIAASSIITRSAFQVSSQSLNQAQKALDSVASSKDPESLREALKQVAEVTQQRQIAIPQGESFEKTRDELVDFLRPQLLQGRKAFSLINRQRLLDTVISSGRSAGLSLIMAFGFAGVATPDPSGPSLLTSLLTLRQTLVNRRQRAAAAAAAAPRAQRKQSPEQIERWKQAQRQAAERKAAERKARANRRQTAQGTPTGTGGGSDRAAGGPFAGLFGQGERARRQKIKRVAPQWYEEGSKPDDKPE